MELIKTNQNLIKDDSPLSKVTKVNSMEGLNRLPRWVADGVKERVKAGESLPEAVAFMARSQFFDEKWIEELIA